jgi:FLVCR family MFS transporter 7
MKGQDIEGVKYHATHNKTSLLAWIELICVILLNMSINLRWLTFSPVATMASEYLQVDMSAITWLANCATLIYIGISASTGWVFEKYGMKTCVSVIVFYLTRITR